METIGITAPCLAVESLALSVTAYWRSGGRRDVERIRAQLLSELDAACVRERALAEELPRLVRTGYEDSLARIKRAEERLARVRWTVSAETRQAIDGLRAQLAEARRAIQTRLEELKTGASTRAEAVQEALHRRVIHMEGRAQLILARANMIRAERLAEKQDFARANDLLEGAVAKVRAVRASRMSDPFEDEPAFQNVLDALLEAIRSVRAQAAYHAHQIERVLSANDALLASLGSHEQKIV